MATTPNLEITKIEASQSQKEVTANEAFDDFDRAISGELVHDMDADDNYTLATGEFLYAVLHITDEVDSSPILSAARNIIVPATEKKYVFWNETLQTLTIKTSAGTGIAVLAGDIVPVYCDGTNVERVGLAPAGVPRGYSIPVFGSTTDTAAGNGTLAFCVPSDMDGMNIVSVVATVHTAGTTGTTDIQLRRRRDTTDADVLSTKVTIDSAETSSITAATPAVVNASNDDLETGDLLFIDVDAVSTTAAKGLFVTVMAETP